MIRKTYRSVRCSLVRETATAPYEQPAKVRNGRELAGLFRSMIGDQTRETFLVVLLDPKNNVIGVHTASIGTADAALVHPREVFLPAIALSAIAVVIAHNHPSGDCTPSVQDDAVTRRLTDAGKLLGIELLDHVVIGKDSYYSSADGRSYGF